MKQLSCSFCGKREDQVKKLIAGDKAVICNECVAKASQIMKDARAGDAPKWPGPPK